MSEENEKKIIELLEKIEENTRKPLIEKPDMSKKPLPSLELNIPSSDKSFSDRLKELEEFQAAHNR